jgi:diguanylate cyclase (GGDEF)-like protein
LTHFSAFPAKDRAPSAELKGTWKQNTARPHIGGPIQVSDIQAIDQQLLQDTEFGLLLLDQDDRIVWLNRAMADILRASPETLLGRRRVQLGEASQQMLSTEPKLLQDSEHQRWVTRAMQRAASGERLLIVQDVTACELLAEENARLRQQVADLQLTDELTGMSNKRAISQALDLHVSRSRRYQNPLSTVLVQVDTSDLGSVQPLSGDPIILAVSRFLRDRLRWVDQIARWEDKLFLLVLPETAELDARGLLEKIRAEQDALELPAPYGDLRPRLSFGLGCWHKGDDMRTLLRRTLDDLRENSDAR